MKKIIRYLPIVFIAFIFLQSLVFKFLGSYETQYIFGVLSSWSGLHWFRDYGAYLVGGSELIATVLLFTRFQFYGALLSVGVMTGAIFFHLFTPLGVLMPEFNAAGEIVGNDSGVLFGMACLVWLAACFVVTRHVLEKRAAACQASNARGEPLC
ncbi:MULTISPECIES: hypothetical protein [Marinomonas]|uniref:hypothetical protein n=1 Tax=Marinomonas TaxID=28253 RepID=UPI001A9DF96C|nr:hypothetical protein [Marinomonas flavescens]